MNNKIFTSSIIILSVLIIAAVGFVSEPYTKKVKNKGEAGPEFAKERDRYFWERLHDPSTGEIPKSIRTSELDFVSSRWNFDNSKSPDKFQAEDIWNRRGPWEVGGRTRALGIDVRDENIIIAGGVSSGMWKSTDAGVSWSKTSLPNQLHSVSCITQDTRPGKENNWYYGTGEFWGNSASISGDGVFKSTDNGSTWQVLPVTTKGKPNTWEQPFDYCWGIVSNPAAPAEIDEILVSTAQLGILRSTDGGTTWNTVLGGQARANFSEIAVTSKGEYYATISSDGQSNVKGIYRSLDGIKWTNITPPEFPRVYRRVVIGISPSDESQVYFLGETPGYGKLTTNSAGDSLWHSLFKYKYNGTNGNVILGEWENRSDNLPKPIPTRGQMNSQSGYNLVIKVKPDNPDVVFIGAVAAYRSNSGFKKSNDWAWIGGTCPDETCDYFFRYTNHHADVHTLLFSKNNYNILYTGSDGGVHKTNDNMSDNVVWQSLNNGYFTTQFYAVAIDHGKSLNRQIIGGLQDNGTLLTRNPDMQNNIWSNPLRADGFYCQIPDDAPYYYASQNATWQPKISIHRIVHNESGVNEVSTRIDPIGGADFIWNTPYILDPNNNQIMYLAGGKMLWRNNDLSGIPFVNSKDSTSINWDSLSKTRIDYVNTAPLGERITAVTVSKKPANVVYYGTSTGRVFKIIDANTGNPEPINITNQTIPKGYISCIAVDPDNANEVIISLSNYGIISILHTTNGGDVWTPISGNLEENPTGGGVGPGVNWINILKIGNKKVYFAATTAGLFSTAFLNGTGTAWQMEGPESIGNVVVHMIDSRSEDGYLVIGTHATGVYETFYKNLPAPPEPVTLKSPETGTKNLTSKINLAWNPASTPGFYELEIAKDPNFLDIIHTVKGITTPEINWDGIEPGRITYYWRVRNVGAGGLSKFSDVWNFTSAIEPPRIVFPAAGSDQVMTYFSFKWDAVDGATSYHLQAAQGFNITNPIVDTIVNATEFAVENFEKNKRYVWRVASIDNDFQGEYGEIYYFLTRHPSAVKSNINSGTEINIYPNPVRETCYISVKSENYIQGKVLIMDMVGRIIEIIPLNNISNSGMTVPVNIKGYSSGIYNVVLVTDKFQIYSQMHVVK
jgi:photosystem II stability/assembly factor-like uncharacterized protein